MALGAIFGFAPSAVADEQRCNVDLGIICVEVPVPVEVRVPVPVPGPTVTVPGPVERIPGPTITVPGPTVTRNVAGPERIVSGPTVTITPTGQPNITSGNIRAQERMLSERPTPVPTVTVTETAEELPGRERVVRVSVPQAIGISAVLLFIGALLLLLCFYGIYAVGRKEGENENVKFFEELRALTRKR